jgi:hypothetical protein
MKSTLLLNFNVSNTMLAAEQSFSLDDVFTRTGGFGKFQFFLCLFYTLAFTSANYVLYNYDNLVMKPVYMCEREPESGVFEECTAEFICEKEAEGAKVNYYVDKDNIFSLDNWVETLDLMCVPDTKIQFMSNWYYLGEIVGGVMITRIPDLYGRKWPLAISTSL